MQCRHSHRAFGLHIRAIGEQQLDNFRMRFLAAFNGKEKQWLVVRTNWKWFSGCAPLIDQWSGLRDITRDDSLNQRFA